MESFDSKGRMRMTRPDHEPGHDGRNLLMIRSYELCLFLTMETCIKVQQGFKASIQEHEQGQVSSTKHFRPVHLAGYESYLLKTDAQRREVFLKTTEGRRLFKQQYRDVLTTNVERRQRVECA